MLPPRSRGVTVFGYILVLESTYHIIVLASAGYAHYAFTFHQYSPGLILIRYIFSWFIKLAGLAAGIGVLKQIDFFRKFAILNSLMIVCLVNLKHPYEAYSVYTKELDQSLQPFLTNQLHGLTFSSITWPALIIQRTIDVVFGLSLIYFFTRPQVKAQFK